jgi:hypothetical protein
MEKAGESCFFLFFTDTNRCLLAENAAKQGIIEQSAKCMKSAGKIISSKKNSSHIFIELRVYL